jgi:hypothetical protein
MATSIRQKVGIGSGIIAALVMSSPFPVLARTSQLSEKGQVLASAEYINSSDTMFVDDLVKDGRGAFVEWYVPGLRSGTCSDTDGAGTPPSRCPLNLPEGRTIVWRLCLNNPKACTVWFSEPT